MRHPCFLLLLTPLVILTAASAAQAQLTRPGFPGQGAPGQLAPEQRLQRQQRVERLEDELDVQNAEIGTQRVQRQTEVMRLETMIRSLTDRTMQLERRAMSTSSIPTITIAEAEAAVALANAKLKQHEQQVEGGRPDAVQLASNQLELARAEGQLIAARASHADRLLQLELDVLYAQRELTDQLRAKKQLERFIAKGYYTTEGLKMQSIEVALAEKQLQRAQLRLKTLREQMGDEAPEAAPGLLPQGSDGS